MQGKNQIRKKSEILPTKAKVLKDFKVVYVKLYIIRDCLFEMAGDVMVTFSLLLKQIHHLYRDNLDVPSSLLTRLPVCLKHKTYLTIYQITIQCSMQSYLSKKMRCLISIHLKVRPFIKLQIFFCAWVFFQQEKNMSQDSPFYLQIILHDNFLLAHF